MSDFLKILWPSQNIWSLEKNTHCISVWNNWNNFGHAILKGMRWKTSQLTWTVNYMDLVAILNAPCTKMWWLVSLHKLILLVCFSALHFDDFFMQRFESYNVHITCFHESWNFLCFGLYKYTKNDNISVYFSKGSNFLVL